VVVLTPDTSAGADSLPRAHSLKFLQTWQRKNIDSVRQAERVCLAK